MTWTILVLVLGIALFLFAPKLVKQNGKTLSDKTLLCRNLVKVIAIVMMAGGVARLYMPYYLVNVNPAIIQEMVSGMQEQQQAEKSKAISSYLKKNMDIMIADAPIWGNKDAKNVIFLWSDYSCPYCRRVHTELARVMEERDDVKVVLKNFSIHGVLSDMPARAVIAAKLQGDDKAAALDKLLMTKEYYSRDDMKDQGKLAEKIKKNVLKFAAEAGLDVAQLEKDIKGDAVNREMKNVREIAEQFEINGTPFLLINGQAFPGAVPADQIIEALN